MEFSATYLAVAGILVSICAGCASVEIPHFSAKTLPSDLQAVQWRAPYTADLSSGLASRRSPRFDYGDEVEITVATGLNASEITRVRATVGRDGSVELPTLGRVPVIGSTPGELRNAVMQVGHWGPGSSKPVVQIALQKPRQHTITVTGAVEHPGIYTLSRQNSDLVSALAAAGGIARDAGPKIVIQSQGTGKDETQDAANFSPTAARVDPAAVAQGPNGSGQRREIPLGSTDAALLAREDLRDRDVVTVERSDPPCVVVSGMIQKPGRYPLPIGQDFRVLDAVATAHGVAYKVIDKVVVCREVAGRSERALIDVSLREATHNKVENLLLKPGDIVSVEPNMRVLVEDTINFISMAIVGAAPIVVR